MTVETADHSQQPVFSRYTSPTDWPWPLALVVAEARRILSYLQNVPKENQPPKAIWHSPKKCADYIDRSTKATQKGSKDTLLEFSDRELEHANR